MKAEDFRNSLPEDDKGTFDDMLMGFQVMRMEYIAMLEVGFTPAEALTLIGKQLTDIGGKKQ